ALAPATPVAAPAAAASTRASVRVLSSPRSVTEAADLVMRSPTTTRLARCSANQRPCLPLPPSPPKHRPSLPLPQSPPKHRPSLPLPQSPPNHQPAATALQRVLERNSSPVLAPA